MNLKILVLLLIVSQAFCTNVSAQVKVEDILQKAGELLNRKELLSVKKGFSPVFSLGKLKLNDVGLLGEKLKGVEVLGNILKGKQIEDIMKLYKTYKTGLVVFKVLAAAGTAVTAYSTVRGITGEGNFSNKTVKAMLAPALTSIATGVLTKILTKKASYKAVDIFNGVVQKKIKDILSVAPASSNMGIGVYVKL